MGGKGREYLLFLLRAVGLEGSMGGIDEGVVVSGRCKVVCNGTPVIVRVEGGDRLTGGSVYGKALLEGAL